MQILIQFSENKLKRKHILVFTAILFFCCTFAYNLHGQVTIKKIKIIADSSTVTIDTILPIPTSEKLYHQEKIISPNRWNFKDKTLTLTDTTLLHQELVLEITELDSTFLKLRRHLDSALIQKNNLGLLLQTEPEEEQSNPFSSNQKGLKYNGSYTRGLSTGNNQDFTLNSAFNLQINGKIADDIGIKASLNDNNIPIQPDGNTQRLQDFDRIFIELQKKQHILTAGDFDTRSDKGYFLKYNKKLQGCKFETTQQLWKGASLQSKVGFALARGKFNRQEMSGLEGNQGPYRLFGKNGERFIIVLSNTERVFLDGVLLKRGADEDYIIDYNRGDVTFTFKKIITRYSRIIVEFEYNSANYLRSTWLAGTELSHQRYGFRFQSYGEFDGKSLVGGGSLTDAQKMQLALSGNSNDGTYITGIDTIADNTDLTQIRYVLKDSIIGGRVFKNILKYAPSADAKNTARFTDVGQGNGNYIRIESTSNGAVYQWVVPDTVSGKLSGNYEPLIRLATPQSQNILSLGGYVALTKQTILDVEIAKSSLGRNLFSVQKDTFQNGFAWKIALRHEQKLDSLGNWKLLASADHEHTDAQFRIFNPYRNAEFNRDWNLQTATNANDDWTKVSIGIQRSLSDKLWWEGSRFSRNNSHLGFRNKVDFQHNGKRNTIETTVNHLQLDNGTLNGTFLRPKFLISQQLNKSGTTKMSVGYESEKNQLYKTISDTLDRSSFQFDMYRVQLTNTLEKLEWNVGYLKRNDFLPTATTFQKSTTSEDYTLSGTWKTKKTVQTKWEMTFRNLYTPTGNHKTLLMRADQQYVFWKGLWRGEWLYEVGSGQEQKIEYNYIKVLKGQGNFAWIDRNNDQIAQLDEFEVAPTQDLGEYVRVVILSNSFVPTNNLIVQFPFSLEPKAYFGNGKKKWQKTISKFSYQNTFRLTQKTRSDIGQEASFFPRFQIGLEDTATVNSSQLFRHALQFNRGHAIYDIQLSQSNNLLRQILVNGLETKVLYDNEFRLRVNYSRAFTSVFTGSYIEKNNYAQAHYNRNYQIQVFRLFHQFTWVKSSNLRIQNTIKQDFGKNVIGNKERYTTLDIGVEGVYNHKSKSNIRTSFNIIKNTFDGISNTPIQYAMLEINVPGLNRQWQLQYDQRLTSNTQISFGYEGRKNGSNRIIHILRAQARATF